MAPLTPCSVKGCQGIAALSFCSTCWDGFCLAHQTKEFHPCHLVADKRVGEPATKALLLHGGHFTRMATAIPMVKHAATALRPNVAFSLDIPEGPSEFFTGEGRTYWDRYTSNEEWLRGGSNLHLPVRYEDGISWIARFRQDHGSKTVRQEETVASEYLTMECLHEVAPAYVPSVRKPLNSYPADFFFMDFRPGKAMSILDFNPEESHPALVRHLATLYIQISSRPFIGIGSLHPSSAGHAVVGRFVNFHHDHVTIPVQGPFKTNRERWLAFIDTELQICEDGLYNWYDAVDVVDYYLARLELRDLVANDEEMATESPTYICQRESKIDQILTDTEGNVTAVLDWEGSYIAPFAEAFASPWGFVNRLALNRGSNALSKVEEMLRDEYLARGRLDLAQAVKGGRKYRRLRGMGIDLESVIGLRDAFLGDNAPPPPESTAQWLEEGLRKYATHPGLESVLKIATARDLAIAALDHELGQGEAVDLDIKAVLGEGETGSGLA